MISNRQHTFSSKTISQLMGALVYVCGFWMSMPSVADDARRIAANHAENWNQSLQSEDVDEVMALYSGLLSTVIAPGGQIAGSSAEIAAFWRKQLKAQKIRSNFQLLSARFNGFAGRGQTQVLIARYIVNTDGMNERPLSFGSRPRRHVDVVLKQEADGQWKTQLQHHWYR